MLEREKSRPSFVTFVAVLARGKQQGNFAAAVAS
jgi:hypothetical protein